MNHHLIPYGKQSISDADIAAVTEALRSGWLTTGPKVAEFEQAFAERVGAKHAVAVCNATAALHLALLVAGVGPNDRVVTSPNTFLASANCAAMVGAIPDFADIDPVSYNLCPGSLESNWKADTKAVIPVHYGGQSADMPAIAEIARKRGAVVIEDACHAVGGSFMHQGEAYKIGGHPWADIATFSFHPVKTMTTGEGGMLVTDNDDYAANARRLRSHGMTREPDQFVGIGDPSFSERGPWYYEMQDLGFNYRMTDLQSALGLSQMARLEGFLQRRREIVDAYNHAFDSLHALSIPGLRNPDDKDLTSWHLYTPQFDFAELGKSRTQFMHELAALGVGSQVLYIPVHLQPWYRQSYGYQVGKCPLAEQFYRNALSLPLYPELTDQDCTRVVESVHKLCSTLS